MKQIATVTALVSMSLITTTERDTMKPVHVTSANFSKEITHSEIPVVVDFWAPWCAPCRAVAPLLDKMAGEYAGQVKVAKINVDENPDLAQRFEVRGIPTLQAVESGQVVRTIVGMGNPGAIVTLFKDLAGQSGELRSAS